MNEKGILITYSNWQLFRAKVWPAWFWSFYRLMSGKARPRQFKGIPLPEGDGKSVNYVPYYSKEFLAELDEGFKKI